MCLLDTDTLSELFRTTDGRSVVASRVTATPAGSLFIGAITVGEVMQGALALIRSLERTNQEDRGYALLLQAFQSLQRFPIATYDAEAHRIFLGFEAAVCRHGRADCQIAATALRHGLIVVTRNTRHFGNMPGIQFEDWTLSQE